jgi:hypothetical protein
MSQSVSAMTKQPIVSGNELIPKDAKLLARTLAELDVVLEVPHMLGQNDAEKGTEIQKRLKTGLEPELPSKLVEDAKAYIDLYGPSLARARAEMRSRQEGLEQFHAQQAAKRAQHSADITARIEAAEAKRQAKIEQWRKENL